MMRLQVPRYESGVVGLPDRAIVLTNTERGRMACPLRWYFAEGCGLVPRRLATPLAYGRAWHEFLEDLHRWWMVHDSTYPDRAEYVCPWCSSAPQGCEHCKGTGLGVVSRMLQQFIDDADPMDDRADPVGLGVKLQRAVEGYLHRYGRDPFDAFRVVAVELRAAVPIRSASGRPYAPQTYLISQADGLRVARHGEASNPQQADSVKVVRWPYFQLMTFDAVLQSRTNPDDVRLYEGKSSSAPERRMMSLSIDPQVAGYAWGLQHVVSQGLIEGVPSTAKVRGYMFDVASSTMQHDPAPNKPSKVKALHPDTGEPYKEKGRWTYVVDASGQPIERVQGLSVSRSATVPSWRFIAAVSRFGLPIEDYREHIEHLVAHADPRLYVREFGTVGREVQERYGREICGIARRLAGWRRKVATANGLDVSEAFPRVAVCAQPGGTCAYRGPCLNDGQEVRRDFDVSPGPRWLTTDSNNTIMNADEGGLGW